ncbi:DEAD/DEAH box helicase [Pseudonocardia alni]|uniref:DEAD/DEAH box helicase n=1 Tax=Pseudonocardia alni TaxID=33907 RepID=UPI0033FD5443
MTSSASDSAYARLAEPVRRWIHGQGWEGLHDVQARSVEPILAADPDVLITASTAGGKTEAAFLPVLSHLVERRESGTAPGGVEVLYLSPLKALINDQLRRLEPLGEELGIPVHPWHGDVPAARRKKVWRDRAGVLLITPESVEGILCHRGERAKSLLGDLRFIVVDELHAFPGSARGAQLSALMHRVDLLARRRVPRIGLSATVGKLDAAAEFLRPGRGGRVHVVESTVDGRDRRTRIHGHLTTRGAGGSSAVARRLHTRFRGTTNLVFANARSDVEYYADRLRQECERTGTPNEFFAHHGSLSKVEREDVEERLRSTDLPATAVCTSTLEMGVDIGQVREVAQVGPPPSVAALRQRWGRAGRRPGDRSVLRTYVAENELADDPEPVDELRPQLVQTAAMLRLIRVHDWCEPPEHGGLHLSTVVQQVLSLTAQFGGVRPEQAESALCSRGPFRRVDGETFHRLLEALHDADMLMTAGDGTLLPGGRGEREIEHYSFLAAFDTPATYRVVAGGQEIGSVDAGSPLVPDSNLVLAGRRWRVVAVYPGESVVEVVPDSRGSVANFPPTGAARVHDRVREEMLEVYRGTDDGIADLLDDRARDLLDTARRAFDRLGLRDTDLIPRGNSTLVLPWRGDRMLDTLLVALHQRGLRAGREGPALRVSAPLPQVEDALAALAHAPAPDPVDLAATVAAKAEEKWDEVLSPRLLDQAYAARALDVDAVWSWLRTRTPAPRPVSTGSAVARPVDEPAAVITLPGAGAIPSGTGYAVVDVETTGLAPSSGHRIVEIAVVRCRADGTVEDEWHTLLDPERHPGPARVHGLRPPDLAGAPRFADIAGDLADRLSGRIVAAHNASFDLRFLTAEFERTGHTPPDWPVLCTMRLLDRLPEVPGRTGRRLPDACAAYGVPLRDAHSAAGDARATAGLLAAQLAAAGRADPVGLGVRPAALPGAWAPAAPSGRVLHRSGAGPAADARTGAGVWPDAATTAYAEAVARALDDGEVTSAETDQLIEVARLWAVGDDVVATVHDRLTAGRPLSTESRRHLDVVSRSRVLAA